VICSWRRFRIYFEPPSPPDKTTYLTNFVAVFLKLVERFSKKRRDSLDLAIEKAFELLFGDNHMALLNTQAFAAEIEARTYDSNPVGLLAVVRIAELVLLRAVVRTLGQAEG
jgi:hypothetical protein